MAFNLASKFPLSQTIDYFELNMVQSICHFYFYTTKDECNVFFYIIIVLLETIIGTIFIIEKQDNIIYAR